MAAAGRDEAGLLCHYGRDMSYQAEPGLFRVGICADSSGRLEGEFVLE